MSSENPFQAPETPADLLPSVADEAPRFYRVTAVRWWLCTLLGTAAAGTAYGALLGLLPTGGSIIIAAMVGAWGFVFAFSLGFVVTTLGLLPLLLLRSLLRGFWFPQVLAAACGGITGSLCAGWTGGVAGGLVAWVIVLRFGRPRSADSFP
ncbi:MAG: hypothetical protein ACKO2L_02645 [Planctomycetaceae bacterium]